MSTYSIRFNKNTKEVEMLGNGITHNIPLTELLMNDGSTPSDTPKIIDNFIRDQSQINYFDSIKDGGFAGISDLLEGLEIYPHANPEIAYNGKDGLHAIEYKILQARRYNLTRTAWLKLKKGHELDPPKEYREIMWESGLGHDVFISPPVSVRKTFGSFIDPLSKTAGVVWPPTDDTLHIEPTFMNLMGFGDSSIEATAQTTDSYNYEMVIKCGEVCKTAGCTLTNTGEQVDKYTLGNNNKKNELKNNKSGKTDEKVKYIIVKEWGDKVQIIIYIMYYFLYALSSRIAVAMLTCDMVVFITSLTFQALCIYTGAFSDERLKLLTEDLSPEQKGILLTQKNQRHYSIVEYKPGNKYDQALIEMKMKIEKIIRENQFFIDSIKKLVDNPDTYISIGSQSYIFDVKFYENALKDIDNNGINDGINGGIQTNATILGDELLNKWRDFFDNKSNRIDINLEQLYKELKVFESTHLLVPFIKIKKGKSNTLTLLSTKSYTAQLPADNNKPNLGSESFQIIAVRHYKNDMRGGMRGGKGLTESDINYTTFVQDDDGKYPYTFDSVNDYDAKNIDVDNTNPDNIDPDNIDAENINLENIDTYFSSINDQYRTDLLFKKLPNKFGQRLHTGYYETDLLKILTSKFYETLQNFNETLLNETDIEYAIYIEDALYTLFVYNSYLSGVGIVDFDGTTLNNLIKQYVPFKNVDELQEYIDELNTLGAIQGTGTGTGTGTREVEPILETGLETGTGAREVEPILETRTGTEEEDYASQLTTEPEKRNMSPDIDRSYSWPWTYSNIQKGKRKPENLEEQKGPYEKFFKVKGGSKKKKLTRKNQNKRNKKTRNKKYKRVKTRKHSRKHKKKTKKNKKY